MANVPIGVPMPHSADAPFAVAHSIPMAQVVHPPSAGPADGCSVPGGGTEASAAAVPAEVVAGVDAH